MRNRFEQTLSKLQTVVLRTNSRAAGNSTFAIGGVSCSADSFVIAESSVLRINICAEKPAHRKSTKRYTQGVVTNFYDYLSVIKKHFKFKNNTFRLPVHGQPHLRKFCFCNRALKRKRLAHILAHLFARTR